MIPIIKTSEASLKKYPATLPVMVGLPLHIQTHQWATTRVEARAEAGYMQENIMQAASQEYCRRIAKEFGWNPKANLN